jgi:drug/metabolite transporter (DMT)-like permease
VIIGVALGLCAAVSQSASYLFSRRFVTRHAAGTYHLLVLSHLIIGVLSLAALPFLWPQRTPPLRALFLYAGGSALFYIAGQTFLLLALRKAEASRLAPLLGLKVFILAAISVAALGAVLRPAQWLAVGMSVAAALLLSRVGGPLSPASIGGALGACAGYSLSDIHVQLLVDHLRHLGLLRATLLGVACTYLLCAAAALAAFLAHPRYTRTQWLDAAPYALSWFAAMVFLFACFGTIGVVFGNIVQSSRGLISIGLGAVIARLGMLHLETRAGPGLLARRIGAALLMTAAIVVFYLAA